MAIRKSGAQVLARIADAEQRAFSAERDAREKERIVAGLDNQITEKRQELQQIEEQKATSLSEIRSMGEAKQRLNALLVNLQSECAHAQGVLEREIQRQEHFKETSSAERKSESQQLDQIKTHLSNITKLIQESEPVAKELSGFISKNKDARTKFLKQQAELVAAENLYKSVKGDMEAKLAEINSGQKDMDALKGYLQDLYGRMGSYVAVIKETVEYANRYMEETGVPIHFAIPDGQLMEIDMFNFDFKPHE